MKSVGREIFSRDGGTLYGMKVMVTNGEPLNLRLTRRARIFIRNTRNMLILL